MPLVLSSFGFVSDVVFGKELVFLVLNMFSDLGFCKFLVSLQDLIWILNPPPKGFCGGRWLKSVEGGTNSNHVQIRTPEIGVFLFD